MATNIAFDIIANDRASRTFNNVGQAADRSTGKLKSFAKIGAVAVAGAAVVAGKALFDMTKNAMADEAAQRKLAVALKNSVKATDGQIASVENWISKQGVALGVTDDELRPAFQRLVQATGSITEAQRQMGIAMDVSAGTGKSLKVVSEALMKANNGTTASLSKLGLKTKDAEGNTLSLDDALKSMSKTFEGQAAAKANTLEGKMGRLNLMFDETKEAIGARLIPVATELADWFLRDGVPALQKFGDWIDRKIVPTLQDLGGFIGDHIVPALQAFGGFIEEHVIPALQAFGEGALKGVKGFLDNVGDSLQENKPFLEALGHAVAEVAGFVYDKLGPALGWLAEHVLPALGKILGTEITLIRKISSAFLTMAEYGIRGFALLLDAAFGAFEGILDAAASGMGWIPGLGDKIKDARDSFSDFRDKSVDALNRTADKLHEVNSTISGIPKSKVVDVEVRFKAGSLDALLGPIQQLNAAGLAPANSHNALGTGYWRGGRTLVGESGPEIVDLPRGSRIYDNARSQAMARESGGGINYQELGRAIVAAMREGAPLVQLRDAGQGAYVSGAAF